MLNVPSWMEAAGFGFSRRLHAVAFLLSCWASSACAQDALLDEARAKLKLRDAVGAYALLANAELQRAGDERFDYLLGVAALDSGHVTRAVFALERVVARRPDDMLARAELGRAYLAAGEVEAAREQLRLARRGQLPGEAAAAIERVLGVIDPVASSSGPHLSGYLEAGAAYDSNVNSATHQGEFAIPAFGGLLFQTAPESRQRHDLVASAAGGANAEAPLSRSWKLIGAANLRAAVDRVVHDMDTVFFDATVGLQHTRGTQSQLIALQSNIAWVGGSLYRKANGASAQWQWQFAAAAQASVFGQWSRQVYSGQEARNTDRLLLGLGLARQFAGAGPLTYGSAYAVQERARTPETANFGHRGAGLRLGLEQRVAADVAFFAEWQYERRHYGGTEPFFDVGRRDRQNDASTGLRWNADRRWQLTAQARRARAASNVVLYDYSRNVFQITAHRSFP